MVVRDLADDGALADALAARFEDRPTIVAVNDPSDETSRALLRAGARGVVRRDTSPSDLASAVDAVAHGFIVLSGPRSAAAGPAPNLTAREREVLDLLARGWSNKQIGARLGVAENTVKFHVASILAKLDATTRTQAVTIGVRRGWIML